MNKGNGIRKEKYLTQSPQAAMFIKPAFGI